MDTKMMTINISMPKALYKNAQKQAKKYHYVSVSEVIRDALRWWMNDNLTRNGFTPEFEAEVLRREKEPMDNDVVWDGKESDLLKYDKSPKKPAVYSRSKRVVKRIPRVDRHSGFVGGTI